MESIPLPTTFNLESQGNNAATITIEPCYPGYGTTLGNALRRVLLSSLPGAAITKVKIDNVQHEFSAIPNVKEDVVDLLLNMKQIAVRLHEGESGVMKLKAKGEKEVKVKDLELPSNIEVGNPDHVIATLTDKSAELSMELTVENGRGYVPVEIQEREEKELGTIALDAIFTPVKNVNFKTEHVRVGQMTNYDKLTIDITTDGTISPTEAYEQASDILVQHFNLLHEQDFKKPKKAEKKAEEDEEKEDEAEESPEEEGTEEEKE